MKSSPKNPFYRKILRVNLGSLAMAGLLSAHAATANLPASPSTLLRELITAKNCYASVANYRGCLQAVNELTIVMRGERIDPVSDLHTAYQSRYVIQAEVLRTLGPFLIRGPGDTERDLPDDTKDRLDLAIFREWLAAVDVTYATEVNVRTLAFDTIIDSLAAENEIPEAVQINALTAYFTYARLDPHVMVLTNEALAKGQASMASEPDWHYGFMTAKEGGALRVSQITRGSGADRAGLFEGDQILAVNGVPADHLRSLAPPVAKKGSSVLLQVLRSKARTAVSLSFKVTAEILSESFVTFSHQRSTDGRTTGYLKVTSFRGEGVCSAVRNAMVKLHSAGVQSWILDLRGNLGGSTGQIECIEGLFLDRALDASHILKVQDGKLRADLRREMRPFPPDIDRATSQRIPPQIFPVKEPLVLLTDESTASASEYLTATLRYYRRALVVGLRTYGKASQMRSDSNYSGFAVAVYATTEVMTLPDGTTHHVFGIEPDFSVPRGFAFAFQKENHRFSEARRVPPPLNFDLPPNRFKHGPDFGKVRACVARFDAKAWTLANSGEKFFPDVQLRTAEEVSRCWLQENYPVNGVEATAADFVR